MAEVVENVENLVLEQLRLIREDLGSLRSEFSDFKSEVRTEFRDVKSEIHGNTMMIFGLSTVIGQIDKRVEHVEEILGVKP